MLRRCGMASFQPPLAGTIQLTPGAYPRKDWPRQSRVIVMIELIKPMAFCPLAFALTLTPRSSFATDPNVLARAAKCPIPEVPESSRIVFLSMSRGGAIATVTFGKKKWDPTFVADVEVEPGDNPI
jgi:hypothetical protein